MATILIIDDDPDVLFAMRMCLEAAGHDVVEAANGTTALQQVKQVKPDLIVCDVMMDTTTEGFHFALTLRSNDPNSEYSEFRNVPIVMFTAVHDTTNIRFAPDDMFLPVDEFVEKPLDPDAFMETVERLLKRQAV